MTNNTESKERGVRGCWRGVTGCNRVRELDNLLGQTQTNPVYNITTHLMGGVEGKEFLVNNIRDEEEVARVVEEATTEALSRTGSAGFPLRCNDLFFVQQ